MSSTQVQPTLSSERLELRPFHRDDAAAVHELCSAREIADTTLNIPHPYQDGMAEVWIASHESGYANGSLANFAVIERADRRLIGTVGLVINADHSRAELGYWIGVPYWNQGYATEAALEVLRFGFTELRLNRIHALCFARNHASGRVLRKLGMKQEGTLRQHIRKWARFDDLEQYGILRGEWPLDTP